MQKHVLAGVAVALAVLIAGAIAIGQRDAAYVATARVLIAPAGDADAVAASDTLSRGTVVGTYAEAYSSQAVLQPALAIGGLSDEERARVDVEARPLAGASAVLIEASAGDPALAERAATAAARATPDLGGYSAAFQVSPLQVADGSAERAGVGSGVLWLALLVAALAAGIVAGVLVARHDGSGLPGTTRRR